MNSNSAELPQLKEDTFWLKKYLKFGKLRKRERKEKVKTLKKMGKVVRVEEKVVVEEVADIEKLLEWREMDEGVEVIEYA